MNAAASQEAPASARDLITVADELERDGRLLDAADVLKEAYRRNGDHALARRLVRLRHEAFYLIDRSSVPDWPAVEPGAGPHGPGLPAVSPSDLTPGMLAGGLRRHGCLHVRGLVPRLRVERLVDGIERAFAACDARAAGVTPAECTPWFEPFRPGPRYAGSRSRLGVLRKWVREGSGVWAADSPPVMAEVLDAIDEVGLGRVITAYLGERPALSINKFTLRRVGLDTSTDWHQDGAFLGEEIRTVNVWLSLSHCGRDAPGLDIVPRRLDRVVETGTEGAMFEWAAGPGVVDRVRGETPVVRPRFEPGDVLLFDELFLHRTAIDSSMTSERYAVEAWFFAPSAYPEMRVPLVF